MYNKKDLEEKAQQMNFVRDNLEKVFRLCDVLKFIHEDEYLSSLLALKGGTAINLFVMSLPRLSVDIDLDFTKSCSKDEMLQYRQKINARLLAYLQSEGYQLNPMTKNPHSIDSWVFQYINAGGNRDIIKVEINYSMRCHVLNPVLAYSKIQGLDEFCTMMLNPVELFASKINALLSRNAVRDLYDVDNFVSSSMVQGWDLNLLRKCVVFYSVVGRSESSTGEYGTEAIEKMQFSTIKSDLLPMLTKSTFYDLESVKSRVKTFINNLMVLTPEEMQFINEFGQKHYQPELLFDDGVILERIMKHPMALWKIRG